MSARFSAPFWLFKSRLSRQIVAWVFASIVAIEVIILIPSYYRRERELLEQLEKVSSEVISSILAAKYPDSELLEMMSQKLKPNSVILGAALYRSDGRPISKFGELPDIDTTDLNGLKVARQRSLDGNRYDIARLIDVPPDRQAILAIRHDSSSIARELYAFTGRIAGLVLLISIFVTVVTMLALGGIVIIPILRLRDDLIAADYVTGNAQVKIDFYSGSVKRSDELGEVMAAFNQMFRHIQTEIRDRICAEAEVRKLNGELEQRVQQRTAQLQAANQDLKTEIIERKRVQEQLLHLAVHDPLTSLPNRTLFLERLAQALNRSQQDADYLFAVLFIDCDRFKVVNDSLGHLIGDQLLIAVARRLESCLSLVDTLARLGGDEFTILLEEIRALDDATRIAKRIGEQLTPPFLLEEQEVFINASIGIVLATTDYQKPEHLLRDADVAMYRAKELGKGRYQVFDRGMHSRALRRLQLETDLRLAVDRREFVVYYQPIISLATGKINGFEALVRWEHPHRGFVSPGEFIPIAEETGLIMPIGEWVLQEACQQLRAWQNRGLTVGDPTFNISVNLSVKQFSQSNLSEQIDAIIEFAELDFSCLKLEITESAIMDNSESALAILQQLQCRQIQLSIDDFGTGYSSLSYLHRFPVDNLKIDRSFVSRIGEAGENLEIVQAIVSLGHNLGMTVTAEGIETMQQLARLRALGCELGQGYFFSKPLDSQSATELLAKNCQW